MTTSISFVHTIYSNATNLKWKCLKDKHVYPIDCNPEDFEDLLAQARSENGGANTLLIIDDLASGKEIKRQVSELTRLSFSGRHESISLLVLTQQYTSWAKAIREQASWVVTFFPADEEDMDVFSKKYLRRLPDKKRNEVLNLLSEKKYAYVLVQLRHPRKKFIAWLGQEPKKI